MRFYYNKSDCLTESSVKENFFWNMMGSLSSSMASIIFSVIVARMCLPSQSDVFSIAFALASQIWTIGNFESGTLQVTDTKNKYSPNDYFSFKIVMLVVSLIASVLVVVINLISNNYDINKAAIVFLFCLYRIAEAFSNYYYSVFQKNEHINIGGFSMFVRTAISAIAFLFVLILGGGLISAILTLLIICLLWIVFYEKKLSAVFEKVYFSLDKTKTFKIFLECLPLFLSSFLITYLINIPKYSIDSLLTENSGIQTAYNAIFQPAAVINLFCLFVFRPTLTGLAKLYNDGKYKKYITMAIKIFLITLVFSAVVSVAALFFGIPVLRLFYGEEYIYNEYTSALLFIIIGGAFYAFSQLLYNMITVIRCQYFMLIGYAVVLITALLFSDKVVALYGIHGAAAVYMFSMILLFVVFFIIFAIAFQISKRKQPLK